MTKPRNLELSRRHVMALAPAIALTAGLTGVGRSALAEPGRGSAAHTAGLALGYMVGSETWDHLDGLTPTLERLDETAVRDEAPLVTASSLATGDGAFAARGARVILHGFMAEPDAGLPAMHLKTHYVPHHELTHLAWSYQGAESCCGTTTTELTLPAHPDHGMKLSLEVRAEGAVEPSRAEAVFTLGEVFGRPKLRRGAYLMSWHLSSDRQATHLWPGMRAIAERVPEASKGIKVTRRLMVAGVDRRPVRLPALLMTVDYAAA